MGFATVEYTGDTASSNNTFIRIYDSKNTSGSTEGSDSQLKLLGMFERVCKKCKEPFDSLKKKAQICPHCKKKTHKRQISGR
jgi:DNA-directed RNA polymerase subunit RPC12/RpoP